MFKTLVLLSCVSAIIAAELPTPTIRFDFDNKNFDASFGSDKDVTTNCVGTCSVETSYESRSGVLNTQKGMVTFLPTEKWSSYTVCTWALHTGHGSTWETMIGSWRGCTIPVNLMHFGLQGDCLNDYSREHRTFECTSIDASKWHYVCSVTEEAVDGRHEIWVDGELRVQRTETRTQPRLSQPIVIGGKSPCIGANHFQGYVDEVDIYLNTALSSAQMRELYTRHVCTANEFFQSSSGKCLPCNICKPGFYETAACGSSAGECAMCPAGSKCAGGKAKPAKCDPGTFQNKMGQSTCEPCGHDSHSGNQGSLNCTGVREGYYGTGGTPTEHTGEAPCDKGHYCPGGAVDKIPCPRGQFQPNPTQSSCITCPLGQYAFEEGNEGCTTVPAGAMGVTEGGSQEEAIGGAKYITPCPKGSKCPNGIRHFCQPGTFQANTAQSKCEQCADGTYSDAAGADGCKGMKTCSVTTYIANNNETTARIQDRMCKSCPPGTFGTTTNALSCTPCQSCGSVGIVQACSVSKDRTCAPLPDLLPQRPMPPTNMVDQVDEAMVQQSGSNDLDILAGTGGSLNLKGDNVFVTGKAYVKGPLVASNIVSEGPFVTTDLDGNEFNLAHKLATMETLHQEDVRRIAYLEAESMQMQRLIADMQARLKALENSAEPTGF
eukprot:m.23164 g.23164  ORF g.23164 m.23164 type:complete len:661 (-) comp7469_c1_seq1:1856-3838(-)